MHSNVKEYFKKNFLKTIFLETFLVLIIQKKVQIDNNLRYASVFTSSRNNHYEYYQLLEHDSIL